MKLTGATVFKSMIRKLQHEYSTDEAIGKQFGVTRQRIHQIRSAMDIPPITDKNKERNSKIIKSYNKGIRVSDIADTFSMSVSQAYRIINSR